MKPEGLVWTLSLAIVKANLGKKTREAEALLI